MFIHIAQWSSTGKHFDVFSTTLTDSWIIQWYAILQGSPIIKIGTCHSCFSIPWFHSATYFGFFLGYLSLTLFLTPARIPDISPLYRVSSRRTSRTWWIWTTASESILEMCLTYRHVRLIRTDEPANSPLKLYDALQQCNKNVLINVWSTNLALSADLGPSELLSVLDSGIAVNFLPLWCEPLVLGHLWNW